MRSGDSTRPSRGQHPRARPCPQRAGQLIERGGGHTPPRSHRQLWHGARRETVPRGPVQHPGREKGFWTRQPEVKGREEPGRGVQGVGPPPRALISSWPQFTGCRRKTCKGWKAPREPPRTTQQTQRGRLQGDPRGGLRLERNVSGRDRVRGKQCFLLAHLGVYKSCIHLTAGQDRHTPGVHGRGGTIGWGKGRPLHRLLRLFLKEGPPPREGPAHPSCGGQRGGPGGPAQTPSRCSLLLHLGTAGAERGLRQTAWLWCLVSVTLQARSCPLGAAGSRQDRRPGLSRRGWGKVPSAVPVLPGRPPAVQTSAPKCRLSGTGVGGPVSSGLGCHPEPGSGRPRCSLASALRWWPSRQGWPGPPLCTSSVPGTGPRGPTDGGPVRT